ncbi:metallophosphatase family protein [Synechococcus sp. AH-707-M23]|nr:metallophosphatase family protein [Synechococcus sp. AH-707-M23]
MISDIHANHAALKAVLVDAEGLNCTSFICLGDVAGYHSEINECIDLLKSLPSLVFIKGNHDQYLIDNTGCPRSKHVTSTLSYQHSVITNENIEWLSTGLDEYSFGGNYFTHGGPQDKLEQYIYRVSEDTIPNDFSQLFVGHTHVQALLHVGNKIFCNPGSVGQPRDGDPRAAYAILNDKGKITLRRVPYNIFQTQQEMMAAGFAEYSCDNLSVGAQVGGRIDSIKLHGQDYV